MDSTSKAPAIAGGVANLVLVVTPTLLLAYGYYSSALAMMIVNSALCLFGFGALVSKYSK